MTIVEALFAIAPRLFGFLVHEHGLEYEERLLGASWAGVRYHGQRVVLQFVLESDREVWAELIPLVDGVEPLRFDTDLKESITNLQLSELLALLDPSWRPPPLEVNDAAELDAVLNVYASAVRAHVQQVLDPSPGHLAQVRRNMQRRAVLTGLSEWARFVENVRSGSAKDLWIGAYARAVSNRATLEDTTDWRDPFLGESRRHLHQLDVLFDEATVPLPWGRGRFLPTPRGQRWWRKPRIMSADLEGQFRRQGL